MAAPHYRLGGHYASAQINQSMSHILHLLSEATTPDSSRNIKGNSEPDIFIVQNCNIRPVLLLLRWHHLRDRGN